MGLPRSGKSTYRKALTGTVISRDDILMEYDSEKSYSEIWETLSSGDHKEIDQKVQKRYQEAVKNKEDIIVDMTNMSKKSRKKWLSNPGLKDYHKRGVVFSTDIETCISRNSGEKNIPVQVICSMARSFSYPRYDEFDYIEMR
jgi:predicted kinase